MSGTPSSTEKARNIKRSRTWRDGGKPLKIPKREQIIRIPATSMKPLKDFQEWITQTEFKLEHCIKVSAEILLDDDVNKSWPMKQEYCDRCKNVRDSTELEDLLQSVNWRALTISDAPDDVPLTLKTLALSARAAAINRCDNVSVKSFVRALFDVTKTHWFCNPHAQSSETIQPKSTKETGGFEVEVVAIN